ncbi:hypothetical protein [Salibacterium sp. K-3]
MHVNTYPAAGQGRTSPDSMKEGGVYRGRVLERNNGGRALLDFQGTKVNASFEGGMPGKNQIAFQVTSNKEGALQVRALQEERGGSTASIQTSGILKKVGIRQPSEGMTKAASIMLQSGSALTKDTAASVERFMDQAPGTREQKLNTIKAAAGKNIEMTNDNLQRVHEGLHNRQTAAMVNEWTSSSPEDGTDRETAKIVQRALQAASGSEKAGIRETAAEIQQKLQQGGSLKEAVQAVKNRLLHHPDLSREAASSLEKAVKEAEFLSGTGKDRLLQALQQALTGKRDQSVHPEQLFQQLQRVAVMPSGADNQALQQLLQQTGISGEEAERATKLTGQMVQLEESAKNRVMQSMNQLVESSAVKNTSAGPPSYLQNMQETVPEENRARKTTPQQGAAGDAGAKQSSVPFETKPMLETTITNRMIKITEEFQQIQQNTVKQLEQTGKILEQNRQNAPQAKQVLEAAIHKLDRSILRSDFTLFTDMKTERAMMQASSRLAEAKQLLSSGKTQAAWKVVDEVRQSVESMELKASEQKVKQMITREETAARNRSVQTALQQTAEQARAAAQEPSPRQVFELIRSLGLNRESEIGRMLTTSGGQQQNHTGAGQLNVKEAMLQLLKHENEGTALQQKSSQNLSNLTGQQLMSKTDHGNNMQQLLFNLPVPVKENMEDLQVYIQSRQEEGEMDWENCNLYFLIETPSLGETGIMMNASDRQLSITLKNDDPHFEETMKPLVEQTTESMKELGYNIQDIQYQPMSPSGDNQDPPAAEEDIEEQTGSILPFDTMKGFDYKI